VALLGYCSEEAPQRGASIDQDGLATALSMSPTEVRTFFRDTLSEYDEAAMKFTEASLLRRFADHLRTAKSLTYDDFDVVRLYLSLKTRPFAILAGLSGTGKSAIGTGLGKALGDFEAIAVRPGWDDLRPLFGHRNAITTEFESRPAADFFGKASLQPARVHSLLLDELNLSQVEHYLADVLAAFEADEGSPLRDIRIAAGEVRSWSPNLRLIGTVNVDESTKGLSPKVLDRANVLEFPAPSHLSLPWTHHGAVISWDEEHRQALGEQLLSALPPMAASQASNGELRPDLTPVLGHIREVAKILAGAGLGIGHRSRNEILAFVAHGIDLMAEANTLGIKLDGPAGRPLDVAALTDVQWLQRVLPHVAGPIHVLRKPLEELEAYFTSNDFPASAERVGRLRKMQFVHFWSAW
jgi:hypothetical protein